MIKKGVAWFSGPSPHSEHREKPSPQENSCRKLPALGPPTLSLLCLPIVLAEFCSFEHYGCKYTEALFLTMSWFQAALIASIDRKCLLSLQGRELPRVSDLLLHCSQVISTRASTLPGFWENLLHCCLSLSCCAGSVLISLVPAYQVDGFSLLGRYTFHSSRKY